MDMRLLTLNSHAWREENSDEKISHLAATIIEKDYDVTIIWDAWSGAWGHKDCKFDMTHCNAKGYKIMEQNIFNVLEPFLRENDLLIMNEE